MASQNKELNIIGYNLQGDNIEVALLDGPINNYDNGHQIIRDLDLITPQLLSLGGSHLGLFGEIRYNGDLNRSSYFINPIYNELERQKNVFFNSKPESYPIESY